MIDRFAERAASYLETEENRRKIRKYVDIYLEMMRLLRENDASEEARCVSQNAAFRRLYNVFYQLRLSGSNGHTSGEIYTAYYRLIEAHQRSAAKPSIEQVLDELWTLTGKVHLSFASKLIGTLYPESAPIWDSNVRILLDIPCPAVPQGNRLDAAAAAYHELESRYRAFAPVGAAPAGEAARVANVFDTAFPDAREIALWKKLDFLLWRMGSRKTRDSI